MSRSFDTNLFREVFDAIYNCDPRIKINGLWGSSEPFFLACLLRERIPFCLITPSVSQAEQIYQEISFFYSISSAASDQPLPFRLFPPSDILPNEHGAARPDWVAARLAVLYQLAREKPIALVASVEAALQPTPDRALLLADSETVKKNALIDREALIQRLHQKGYQSVPSVTQPGEYSARGGIIDLYPPTGDHPLRITLFDDTIESIRTFDPVSQKSVQEVDSVLIIPGQEKRFDSDLNGPILVDTLPEDTVLIYDEPDAVELKIKQLYKETGSAFSGLWAPPNRTIVDLESLSIGATRGARRFTFDIPSLASLGLERFGQSFTEVTERLNQLRSDHIIVVAVRTPLQADRFKRLLNDYQLPWGLVDPASTAMVTFPSPIFLSVGDLSEGFLLPRERLIFVTDEILSGHLGRKRATREVSDPRSLLLSSVEELRPSDYVVHADHGIGQYSGMKRLSGSSESGEKYESDFLVIRYAGGNTLYVPLDALKRVSRYIGPEGSSPPLDALGGAGGSRWGRTKEKVRKTIQEMTGELLTLYAQREVVSGHAYQETPHLEAFAAAFEYEETPDQLRAVEDVLNDMQGPKPMDRLICGDVGYGKTEVAMRAAFLAVMDNKQVAMLVPTTLLARQHGETFRKRFAPFPVRVATLSRFNSRAEEKGILSDLEKGGVDIVIGTHRLLQKDVAFHDLGLMILDEEHRFGVKHKERLKQLRKDLDVLTLTATPIPRTLQMALGQIRELTVIETPPVNRLAIRTQLAPFDSKLIREIIFRELVRKGQVFFVHNRVHDIEQIGTFLAQLVPEAKIGIAHGQMREGLLEGVISRFISGEYNLLLTTTIIESGLDIPSANTIIINNADQFGLAELYQLRGRVGRAGEQAYAYLLVQEKRVLTEAAQRRLQTIQEFVELGAGFKIAARDLEIRGAGNLLGSEQSGQIAAIGFDLYLKMIDETVRAIKGTTLVAEVETEIQLQCSAYISEEYLPDTYQRLTLYRRLSTAKSTEQVVAIEEEMTDRYGELPQAAIDLLRIVRLKRLAIPCRVTKITQDGKAVTFVLDGSASIDPEVPTRLLKVFKKRIRFLTPFSFELQVGNSTSDGIFLEITHCLTQLRGA
jgi:transcription-repair coupling factor (superfamily II helicase)